MEPFSREIFAFKNYYQDFYLSQPLKVQEKIEWVINLIQYTRFVPEQYLKHLEGTAGL